jgi:hypothetical protein
VRGHGPGHDAARRRCSGQRCAVQRRAAQPNFDFQVKGESTLDPWAFAPGIELHDKTKTATIAQVNLLDL